MWGFLMIEGVIHLGKIPDIRYNRSAFEKLLKYRGIAQLASAHGLGP
jgi:hypothetical protein